MTDHHHLYGSLPVVHHPVPHLSLPIPHDDLCLTPYFPEFDTNEQYRLMIQPSIGPLVGVRLAEYDLKAAREDIQRCINRKGSWNFQVIRRVEDVKAHRQHEQIPIAGTFSLYVDNLVMGKLEAGRCEQPVYWRTGNIALHPEFQGRGIMTAVGHYILTHWFIPSMHPFPGQLNSGWLSHNTASAKLHLRLGFRPVGIEKRGGARLMVAVWDGAGVTPGRGVYDKLFELEELPENWDHGFKSLSSTFNPARYIVQ